MPENPTPFDHPDQGPDGHIENNGQGQPPEWGWTTNDDTKPNEAPQAPATESVNGDREVPGTSEASIFARQVIVDSVKPGWFTRRRKLVAAIAGTAVFISGGVLGGIFAGRHHGSDEAINPGQSTSAPVVPGRSASPDPTPSTSETPTPSTAPSAPQASSSETSTTSPSEKTNAPHQFKLDDLNNPHVRTEYAVWFGSSSPDSTATNEGIKSVQETISKLQQYGVLDKASSDNPYEAMQAYFKLQELAIQKGDPQIATWQFLGPDIKDADGPGVVSKTSTIHDMQQAIKMAKLGFRWFSPGVMPPGILQDPTINKPPYYSIITSDNSLTQASVGVHVQITMVTGKNGSDFTNIVNQDELLSLVRVSVIDQTTNEHHNVWLIVYGQSSNSTVSNYS